MEATIRQRRVKTPVVIQMEASECGAAALGIVLGYYQYYLSLEELRIQCGVSRDGVSAYNIVQAAHQCGMEASGYRATSEELKGLAFPLILFWKHNHFVVLEGFDGSSVYINDPAVGRYVIDEQEFKRSYSEVVLEIKPSPDFVKKGQPPSLFAGITARLRPFLDALIYLFFVQFAMVILALTLPVFFRIFIDKILGEQILSWQWEFLGLLAAVVLLTGFLTWMRDTFLNVLRARIEIHFSTEFLWHILHLPFSFFAQRSGGEVISRMDLNSQVASTMTSQVVVTLLNLLFMGIYVAIMFQYDVLITSLALATALFNLALLWRIGHLRMNTYARLQQEQAKTVAISLDTLMNMETVKCTGNEDFFFSRIMGRYTTNMNAEQEIGRKDAWLFSLSSISQLFSTILLLGVGVLRVMHGGLTVGMLIGLQILLSGFLKPIGTIVQFGSRIQSFKVDLNRLNDVLKNSIDPLSKEREGPTEKLAGSIEFRNVDFGYSTTDHPLIADFNLSIPAGTWVGLVGGVGSGKSTLARLACSLYTPWRGQILYDGRAAETLSRSTLSYSLASVDQEISLFSGTIRENLTLWDPSVPLEVLIQAAQDACIHEDIIARPGGYESHVLEGGRNFSEGQRQRLELARALALQPSLLILDEATRALDSETEAKVIENLRKRHCTCLIIAHRLSTTASCNEIIVLDQGKIVQRGTYHQLKESAGLYKNLLREELLA